MLLALPSRKGGVGKTTAAVNLAAALSAQHRVLLIDLDPQACASLSLGIDREALAPSMADVLHGRLPASEAIRSTASGPDLITGSIDLASVDECFPPGRRRDHRLADRLKDVRKLYDFVIVDLPVTLGAHARQALAAADGYLLPTQLDFLSREGLDNLRQSVSRLCLRLQSHARLLGVVPTLVDRHDEVAAGQLEELRQQLGDVLLPPLHRDPALARAPERGATVLTLEPQGDAAREVRALTLVLLERIGREDSAALIDGDRRPERVQTLGWEPPLRPSEN